MGQSQSSKSKRGSQSQPASATSTPAPSNRRRHTKSGDSTPNLGRGAEASTPQRRRPNAPSNAPNAPSSTTSSVAPATAVAATKPQKTKDAKHGEFSAPLALVDDQIHDSKFSSEDDFAGSSRGILDEKIKSIQRIDDDGAQNIDADDDAASKDDADDFDSEEANQETLEAAKALMARAQVALHEAKKREDEIQLTTKLALSDQRFLDDGPTINDSSLREVLCYLKDKGGGALETESIPPPTIESDSDGECPDLVDEEDGPILPVVDNEEDLRKDEGNPDVNEEDREENDDDPTTDLKMTTAMTSTKQQQKSLLISHEVDIFNPVQDPVKRDLMMRAKESLSVISDAVFSPIKSPLRDTAIPVSDIKIVDPEIRNMSAAAAFEQLDIEANLTEEERIRKALDEYALMMGAADKLIAESRQKAADADTQRDFMRLKADAKIEEAKKRADVLEAKKREIEMLMEANELEMKAKRMKQEAQRMKDEAEKKKEAERARMEEMALRELEIIEEKPKEEEEAQKAEEREEEEEEMVTEVAVVEAAEKGAASEIPTTIVDDVVDGEAAAAAELVFIPANEEIPQQTRMDKDDDDVEPVHGKDDAAAKEKGEEERRQMSEEPDLSSLLHSLDILAAKGEEMAFEQNKTMSILKPLVSDMLLNIEEKEAQLEDIRNEPMEKDDEEIPRLDQQNERLFNGLREMYNNKFLFDYVLVVEGKGIPCHKCVLYASSPYFRQYFQICEKPKEEHSMKLENLNHESVQRLVDYMYTNQLTVNAVRVRHLFDAAVYFEMDAVVGACEECVKESLHVKNAIDFFRFFRDRDSEKMKELTTSFILDRFPLISLDHAAFASLTLDELLFFVSSDKLNAEFEEFVFEAVMQWVVADVDDRVESLLPLLQQIRFLFINGEYISESIATHEIIKEKLPCRALVSSARIAKLTFSSTLNTTDDADAAPGTHLGFSTSPRLGMFSETALVFVGGGDTPQLRSLHCYHPDSKTTYALEKPTENRATFKHTLRHHRVVSTGVNRLFCLGGVLFDTDSLEADGTEKYVSLDSTMSFDSTSKSWTECAPMPTTRCFFASAAVGSKIYVFGGRTTYQAGSTLSSALVYDSEEDVWSPISPLPRPAFNCEAIASAHDDRVYILGGIDEYGRALDLAYLYDPATDSYEALPPMLDARAAFGVTFIDDNLLVMGGYGTEGRKRGGGNLQDSEMFKRRKRTWTKMPEFPEDRRNMILFFHDSTLYAGGGSKVIASRTKLGAKTVAPCDLFRFDREMMAWVRDVKYVKNMNSDGWSLCKINTKRLVKA